MTELWTILILIGGSVYAGPSYYSYLDCASDGMYYHAEYAPKGGRVICQSSERDMSYRISDWIEYNQKNKRVVQPAPKIEQRVDGVEALFNIVGAVGAVSN